MPVLHFFFSFFLLTVEDLPPPDVEKETIANWPKEGETIELPSGEEAKSPRENGEMQSNGITEPKSDRDEDRLLAADGKPRKSRFLYSSPCLKSFFVLTSSGTSILSDIDEQEPKCEC